MQEELAQAVEQEMRQEHVLIDNVVDMRDTDYTEWSGGLRKEQMILWGMSVWGDICGGEGVLG